MRATAAPCGTKEAYRQHNWWGEVPDYACLAAHARYRAELRKRTRMDAEMVAGRPVTHREAARIMREMRATMHGNGAGNGAGMVTAGPENGAVTSQ